MGTNEDNTNYDISFFKPTTELARKNRNLTIWLLLIWVVAIFGFHIVLKVIEKPTPEPIYGTFENVWQNIQSNTATEQDKIDFSYSTLSVLCKVFITPEEREILDNAFGATLYSLLSNDKKSELLTLLSELENYEIGTENYEKTKSAISSIVATTLNIEEFSIQSKISPLELKEPLILAYNTNNNTEIEAIMQRYLIHNQSFLTDFTFLGFPFHYFYTAVFLLILFVGICWFYCMRIDKTLKELGIEEVHE